MSRINRSRAVFLVLSLALVLPLVSSTLFSAAAQETADEDSLYKYLSVFTEVLRLVRSVYVEETDLPQLMAGALDGAADALDPFSVYVPSTQIERYRRAKEIGRGRSGLVVLKDRGVAYVIAVDRDSPAAQAGLETSDIVAKIDGLSTRSMPAWQILEYLTAESGTVVELEVIRQGAPRDVELTLAEYERPEVAVESRDDLMVVRIPELTEENVTTVERLLQEHPESRMLLDLRGVAGGDPSAAYRLAGRFAAGELGSLVRDGEPLESFSADGSPLHAGELGLLVDHGSQGAAEVLITVLRQQGRATVLGETTFGHAGRAELIRLGSGAFLDLTDAFYAGPDGEPLDEGLEPDVEIALRVFGASEPEDGKSERDDVLEEAIERFLEQSSESDGERAVA